MKISDPIMKEFTFEELANDARTHLEHIISISHNSEDMLFKLSGFLGGFTKVLKEKYPVQKVL